jgi:hypothetical protein
LHANLRLLKKFYFILTTLNSLINLNGLNKLITNQDIANPVYWIGTIKNSPFVINKISAFLKEIK